MCLHEEKEGGPPPFSSFCVCVMGEGEICIMSRSVVRRARNQSKNRSHCTQQHTTYTYSNGTQETAEREREREQASKRKTTLRQLHAIHFVRVRTKSIYAFKQDSVSVGVGRKYTVPLYKGGSLGIIQTYLMQCSQNVCSLVGKAQYGLLFSHRCLTLNATMSSDEKISGSYSEMPPSWVL